jgi:hypothetical protein
MSIQVVQEKVRVDKPKKVLRESNNLGILETCGSKRTRPSQARVTGHKCRLFSSIVVASFQANVLWQKCITLIFMSSWYPWKFFSSDLLVIFGQK